LLYHQGDYVTLEWDGVNTWYVIATSGPVASIPQNAAVIDNQSSWTVIGGGLSIALAPGVYDIFLALNDIENNSTGAFAIGNGTTVISNIASVNEANSLNTTFAIFVQSLAYEINTATTIYGIFNGYMDMTYGGLSVGRIWARRIG
jgi:hypothetical protein